jgi:TolB protein
MWLSIADPRPNAADLRPQVSLTDEVPDPEAGHPKTTQQSSRVVAAVVWLMPLSPERIRLYAFFLLLSSLLGAIGFLAARDEPEDEALLPPKARLDLIAFAGTDFRINTVRPDGTSLVGVSDVGGLFTWPIWSPDGTRVAYSGQMVVDGAPSPLELRVHTVGEDHSPRRFASAPGMVPILPGMPYYPLWSPNSTRLSLMADAPQGLTLFLIDLAVEESAEVALVGSPLYAGWSADSTNLLVHVGLDHVLVSVENEIVNEDLRARANVYRAPAWWPSGRRAAIVFQDETGAQVLYILDTDTRERTRLADAPEEIAFLWSPDGTTLAVAMSDSPGDFLYEDVAFYSPDGAKLPLDIDEPVVAFFWSPDSTKLAYVTLSQPPGALRWMFLDLTDGRRWPLVDFTPTQPQLTLFQFFDQFAYSHSMWSPDSRSLVFAGALDSSRATQASFGRKQAAQIIVTQVRPSPDVASIADGFLAVWSPR